MVDSDVLSLSDSTTDAPAAPLQPRGSPEAENGPRKPAACLKATDRVAGDNPAAAARGNGNRDRSRKLG